MHALRTYLSWLFAFTALVCAYVSFSLGTFSTSLSASLRMIHEGRLYWALFGFGAALMMPVFAVVFGLAWWTVFKRKSSARIWGTAASLITIQAGLFPIVFPPHSVMSFSYLLVGMGVTGLVAFARKIEQPASEMESHASVKITGDGTNEFINRSAYVLMMVAALVGYQGWLGWVRDNGVPAAGSSSYQIFVFTCLGFVIVALHELGHTLVGLAMGMKLRAFIIGPFQWQLRDGKWEFDFDPKQILVGVGKTGVVPPRPDFARWAQLCMSGAGVFANVITGIIAFLAVPATGATELGGLLALFGIWSVLLGLMNLVPFRAGYNYSDGAQLYQLLSSGPWADFHRVITVAGAGVVTSVRPRDFDISAIHRAGETINEGFQGFLLRVLAYSYFLDSGKFPEAAAALSEAGLIYNQSASDAPPELLTPFVFGTAYISHDASVSRQWWEQMKAKKPTRLNVDYWLAASALHWIEGNAKEAREAWENADAQARQLPKAGAYDFDRHCCVLLRQALDESSTPIPDHA
jgi:Peptidase family M50